MVCSAATSIIADVDDEAVFTSSSFVNMMFEFFEFTPCHASDVEVAEFPFAGVFDKVASFINLPIFGEAAC